MIRIFYVYMSDAGEFLGQKAHHDAQIELDTKDYCKQFNICQKYVWSNETNLRVGDTIFRPTVQHWMEI